MTITPKQLEVLKQVNKHQNAVSIDVLSEETGMTKRSLTGFLNRLVRDKYARKLKSGYKILKKGKVEIGGTKVKVKAQKKMTRMRVDQIEQIDSDSLIRLTTMLLDADKLPPEVIEKIAKKHNIKPNDSVGLSQWPDSNQSAYRHIVDTGSMPEKMELPIDGFVKMSIKKKQNGDPFGSGTLYYRTYNHSTDSWNESAAMSMSLNMVGNAQKKALELLGELDKIIIRAYTHSTINWVKVGKMHNVNFNVYCHDFLVLDDVV